MTIKEALRNIISALGGTSTGKNIPSLIDEISENASGGSNIDSIFVASVCSTFSSGVLPGKIDSSETDGVFNISDETEGLICSTPVKRFNLSFSDNYQGSPIHAMFVPDKDFEGLYYNGTLWPATEQSDEMVLNGYSLYMATIGATSVTYAKHSF